MLINSALSLAKNLLKLFLIIVQFMSVCLEISKEQECQKLF